MIEDFGGQVATVWSQLRPATRKLVEQALQPPALRSAAPRNSTYDARADFELSKLLAALDEGLNTLTVKAGAEKSGQLRLVADTCAAMLREQTQSAEVFVQLVERAQSRHDYKQIDVLADALTSRFAMSEVCELARSQNNVVRALAEEALTQVPPTTLAGLINDPVDATVARQALQRQVREFGLGQAHDLVTEMGELDLGSEDK